MSSSETIHIVGISDDGLAGVTEAAARLIREADLLIGPEQALALVGQTRARHLAVGADPDQAVREIAAADAKSRIVVLSIGDPLFYGVARYLCDKLGKERFEVVPHVSSMQLAFARVKESWEEAYLADLASKPLPHVVERVRTADKAGLFTTAQTPPKAVLAALLERGIDGFFAYVCENLGSPDERVTQGELRELAGVDFSPLNVLILVRKPGVPDLPRESANLRLFGNPADAFLQSQPKHGLLTPAEVRAMALGEMDLGPQSIVWDIGAGSGSVAIEAAQLAHSGQVFAVEMDPEDHALILANAERFGVANLTAILGRAPEAWAELPPPDAVFVGGSGREVSRVVELAYERLKPGGRLVANVGSIDNLSDVHAALARKTPDVQVWMINIAHGTQQLERLRFESLNPTFLIGVVKPA